MNIVFRVRDVRRGGDGSGVSRYLINILYYTIPDEMCLISTVLDLVYSVQMGVEICKTLFET